jgi:3-oxoacyl-[acyl-carrier-protein] synthase-1
MSGELLSALLSRTGLTISEKTRRTIFATAVGFVSALQHAEAWLAEGVGDRCVVGCVDSLLDPTTLEALDGLGLLKTPQNPVGFIPGEAACFLLVESQRRHVHRTEVQATLASPVTVSCGPHPRLGGTDGARDALANTISQAFAGLSDGGRSTGVFVVNLNGDPYRISVWGDSLVRVLLPMQLGETPVWLPPLFFGDTGAATGFVSVALLARGWARHYAAPNALVCLTDDLGGRGAFYVRAPA